MIVLDALPTRPPGRSPRQGGTAGGGAVCGSRVAFGGRVPERGRFLRDRTEAGYQCSVRASGHVLELSARWIGQAGAFGGGVRGAVRGFSGPSRRRLFRRAAAVDWSAFGRSVFVTLTYPGEFPCDGRRVKRDLATFRKAWERRYGPAVGMWKMEYQRRGAPHFHLALAFPSAVPAGLDPSDSLGLRAGEIKAAREWAGETWYRIVGSGDERHRRAGVQVDVLADNPAAYFAGYVGGSKGSKDYQNCAPAGFESAGRVWGAWNLRVEWDERVVPLSSFFALRRVVRGYGASRRRADGSRADGLRVSGRVAGGWQYVDSSAVLFLAAALRLVE